MKFLFVLVLFSASAFADTLTIITPTYVTTYTGDISQLDKEDSISQVEINNAVSHSVELADKIFYDGFEFSSPNWIWVGDTTDGKEFGFSGRCTETDHKNSDSDLVVFLDCTNVHDSEHRLAQ